MGQQEMKAMGLITLLNWRAQKLLQVDMCIVQDRDLLVSDTITVAKFFWVLLLGVYRK